MATMTQAQRQAQRQSPPLKKNFAPAPVSPEQPEALPVKPLRLKDLPHILLACVFVYLVAADFQPPWILQSAPPADAESIEPVLHLSYRLPALSPASEGGSSAEDMIVPSLATEGKLRPSVRHHVEDLWPSS